MEARSYPDEGFGACFLCVHINKNAYETNQEILPKLGQIPNQRFEKCPALGKCSINDLKNARLWANAQSTI